MRLEVLHKYAHLANQPNPTGKLSKLGRDIKMGKPRKE